MPVASDKLSLINRLTARDIMTRPVITVRYDDSIRDVARTFVANNISGAAVVDEAGLPVGVITKTDLAVYDLQRSETQVESKKEDMPLVEESGEPIRRPGFHIENEDESIKEWMTPFVCDVELDTPIAKITKKMVQYGFHHVFVVDKDTKLIQGVITTFDMLQVLSRALNPDLTA